MATSGFPSKDTIMALKSAYELAMEKLAKKSPQKKLSEKQLKQIAELDSVYKAKLAERETFLQSKIAEAKSIGNFEGAQKFQAELVADLQKIRDEWESKK